MCIEPNKNSDDLVELAIDSLRNAADVSGPPPQLIAQTLARLELARKSESSKFNWGTIMMKPAFRFSAAAAIAVAMLCAFWLLASNWSNVAFAEVIAKVGSVRSVSYNIAVTQAGSASTAEVTIAAPSRMRTSLSTGMISIYDAGLGKTLMLNQRNKSALLMTSSNAPKAPVDFNILDQLKQIDSADFERVEDKTIEGRVASGFKRKVTTKGVPVQETIWVDRETQLPLEMDAAVQNRGERDVTVVFSHFKWNVPIDESLFSLVPPEGYKVQNVSVDASPESETDLVAGLQAMAQLNNNVLPDRFDMTGLLDLTKALARNIPAASQSPEATAERQKLMQPFMKISRGIAFTAKAENGSDWHYAGKGVALFQGDAPILWYRPKGSEKYRVIDASLSVHEVSANDLPSVESILLGPTTGPSTGH